MTLVETVVAMVIFAVAATVTLTLILGTARTSGDGIRRTAAANLVQGQLESVRSLSATMIPDGLQVTTRTVGSVTYTIRQNANYLTSASSGSVCTGGGSTFAYKHVTISVTWPNMGAVQPVRGDTLKSVGIGSGGLDQSTVGSLAILVTGYDAQPRAGVTVSLPALAATRLTGDDGCAVFTSLPPGTYSVSLTADGFVGVTNTQATSAVGLSVAAGAITRSTISYDAARSVSVALSDATSAVPVGMPLRIGDSYVAENTLATCPGTPTSACSSGLPGDAQQLYPAVYTVKAGACTETTPSSVIVDLRTPVATPPTVTLPVGTVTLNVATGGTSLDGRAVTVTHAGGGCTESYAITSTAGGAAFVLPYGQWTLSTLKNAGQSGSTVTSTVTLSPTTPTSSVTLSVLS